MISFADTGKAKSLHFGDLTIDEACMFAHRNGQTLQFTKNERALLLAFTSNPQRLMTRGRLLDEIAQPGSDSSDRNIDFLVNRLRLKLGDNAKSPTYIATQYGEGYVWIATPSRPGPIDAFLIIGSSFELQKRPLGQQGLSLMNKLRDLIAVGIGGSRKVAVADRNLLSAYDKSRYFLQVSFHADTDRLNCAATLQEMPSKRIVKAFRLHLDVTDNISFVNEATRVSKSVVDALQQALEEASNGLGILLDETPEARLRSASNLLSTSNSKWLASGERLAEGRSQAPLNADAAIQWGLHLFARLVLTSPFDGGMSLEERDRIESEIEATVLECLPEIEDKPLLMLGAAKLLYFINRGHLDLAEEIVERALTRALDSTAGLPILGQLRYARGRFDEAVGIFDQGIRVAEPGSEFHRHMRVLKCIALLGAGHSAASAARATDMADLGSDCPPQIRLMIGWMVAAPDQKLPEASEHALAALGPDHAAGAIEYLYFTSARHITLRQGRANVMRNMIAHVSRLYGKRVIPDFVLRSIGSVAAV
ncbi:winged helix family transcriptional regulator [Rhizobium sp. S9]|uniref:winged helix-turn-helix domain-containing protein n=1 Tax=unclassified Rhizobium TaxID=2613769 RepID=UPI000A26CE85|nr:MULTISPECIES: winged helix-turn-helix domain-containing protein [unclassified Rhizobium]PDS98861.1 winged helix family transcriptional regulator [Rhizobium sp. S9]